MTADFERVTAVLPTADTSTTLPLPSGQAATFAAEIAPGWGIVGMTNGGYLMAIAARAMIAATGRLPLTVTAHFLRPAPPGPCTIDVTAVRVGRRMATVTATLNAGEQATPALTLVATLHEPPLGGAAGGAPAPGLTIPAPPLPIDDCVRREPFDPTGDDPDPGFVARVALAIRAGDLGFSHGAPTGTAEVQGWFAFPDQAPDHVLDPCAVLLATDAFFPPVFNLGGDFAWVPTIELTVHLRATPVPGPLQARFRTSVVGDGLLNEDGELWDSAGNVVAQSRQLALLPRPR